MLSTAEQPTNAKSPMLVTEFGISMLLKPEQPLNAKSPMLVTEFGISMLLRPVQPANAFSTILVTEYGIIAFSPKMNFSYSSFMIAPLCKDNKEQNNVE